MFRKPEEPNPDKYPKNDGVLLPICLDFTSLLEEDSESYKTAVSSHIDECILAGIRLTDPSNTTYNVKHITTKVIPVSYDNQKIDLEIRVESIDIKGAANRNLKGVRHIAKLKYNNSENNNMNRIIIEPLYLLDVYNRLNYTDAIDKFTYLVEKVQMIHPLPKDNDRRLDNNSKINWCHVAYTADHILPSILGGTVRDFVTFDFVSEKHMLINSRSCAHPSKPETTTPSVCGSSGCCASKRNNEKKEEERTYRVPLQYFTRILPANNTAADYSCTVVQFQFSDIGGIIPPRGQTKAVVQFGLESLPKFFAIAMKAKEKGLNLGPRSVGYMKNPLDPCWRQQTKDMIPGLE